VKWPPKKSWTKITPVNGFRHFVAINYGIKGNNRWVSMISVLDGNTKMKVDWKELCDSQKWKSGWHQLSRESSRSKNPDNTSYKKKDNDNTCLHPSSDSGLLIPTQSEDQREWS
tara:strand:- start:166 stop:507 length:342 start_codon:yes stop_codon:yes gene_type:complete